MPALTPAQAATQVQEIKKETQDLLEFLDHKKAGKVVEVSVQLLTTKLAAYTQTELHSIGNDPNAFQIFDAAFSTINRAAKYDGVGHLPAIKQARDACQAIRKGRRPKKTVKSKAIVDSDDDPDAEGDIEDVTPTRNPCNSCSLGPHGSGGCPGEEGKGKRPVDSDKTTRGEPVLSITIDEDVNMEPTAGSSASGNSSKGTSASQRATTVSIPYSMVPGMDTSSQPYRRAQYFLMQAVLNAKVTSKRARVTDSVDVRTPSAADAERSSGTYSRRLLEDVALLPFAELKSKPSDTLKALANFLLVQIDQSLFQAHRALAEYKTSQTLRAEALRVLLERADISQDAAEAPILGAEGVSAASASMVQPFQPST
ncbi:hypothetical protein VKT23_019982 [Stygiomarasmius scandens]|uniref:Uncharacterized protein n=1 Tax=Marasmiellus scandens TaxID=2682957 RepID=A0ABR1IM28_9AGAR